MNKVPTDPPIFVSSEINLASPRLGSKGVEASDEFFAPLPRMLSDSAPIFIPDKFDQNGKWMDGWETRRRRHGGHDWSIIALGAAGRLRSVNIDTTHFTGNYPPQAKLEGCMSDKKPDESTTWHELVAQTNLKGDSHNIFPISINESINWVRLSIYPDGGIARLRLMGDVCPDFSQIGKDELIETSHLCNGGHLIAYNDAHYGDALAILSSGRGKTMGDGWETRRRRTPGNDWIIIALGHATLPRELEIDTAHFKGNCPAACSVQGGYMPNATAQEIADNADSWNEILSRSDLEIDSIHRFRELVNTESPITHVRLNVYPDGGVSRFRLFGTLAK